MEKNVKKHSCDANNVVIVALAFALPLCLTLFKNINSKYIKQKAMLVMYR